MVNTVLIATRALCEEAEGDEKVVVAMRVLFVTSGAFALMMAGLDLTLVFLEFPDGHARNCGISHGIFAAGAAVWMFILAGLWSEGNKALAAADTAVEILLGIAELTTTLIAVGLGAAKKDELSVVGFRVGNWLLRAVQKMFDGADNSFDGENGQPSVGSSAQEGSQSKRVITAKGLSLASCILLALLDSLEGAYLASEGVSGD